MGIQTETDWWQLMGALDIHCWRPGFKLFLLLCVYWFEKNVNWLPNNRLFAKQHDMERKGGPEEKSPKSINQTNFVPASLRPTTPHYDQQYCNFPRTGTFS